MILFYCFNKGKGGYRVWTEDDCLNQIPYQKNDKLEHVNLYEYEDS